MGYPHDLGNPHLEWRWVEYIPRPSVCSHRNDVSAHVFGTFYYFGYMEGLGKCNMIPKWLVNGMVFMALDFSHRDAYEWVWMDNMYPYIDYPVVRKNCLCCLKRGIRPWLSIKTRKTRVLPQPLMLSLVLWVQVEGQVCHENALNSESTTNSIQLQGRQTEVGHFLIGIPTIFEETWSFQLAV